MFSAMPNQENCTSTPGSTVRPPSEFSSLRRSQPASKISGSHRLEKLRVYVGFDSREELAYEVCRYSLLKRATLPLEIVPLKVRALRAQGIYTRARGSTESTEFSFTRFLTPFLAGFHGWALFVDCDFLYTADVRELTDLIDDRYAVMCVHHEYTPTSSVKMDGVPQTCYPRKNWSSMVLYNCAHAKNQHLTPELVNSASGAFLHRFMWLEDADVGELPVTWNFLVGHNEAQSVPKAIHFTCGGPWFDAWKDCEFAELWLRERDEFWNSQLVSVQQTRLKEGQDFMCNALCSKSPITMPFTWHCFTCGGPGFDAWKDCEFAELWPRERDQFWNSQLVSIQQTRLKEGQDFMCNALCL